MDATLQEQTELLVKEGLLHWEQKQYKQARSVFDKAVKADPANAEARAWLAACLGKLIETGTVMDRIRLHPLLNKELAAALELAPMAAFPRKVNALKYLNTPEEYGGNPAIAIEELKYCISQGLADFEVWYSLGLAYLRVNDSAEAKDALQQALHLDPDNAQIKEKLQNLNG